MVLCSVYLIRGPEESNLQYVSPFNVNYIVWSYVSWPCGMYTIDNQLIP